MISPLPPQGGFSHRCMVKHILTVDWKHWNCCWSPCKDKDITLKVLERVAGITIYITHCSPDPRDYLNTLQSACIFAALYFGINWMMYITFLTHP